MSHDGYLTLHIYVAQYHDTLFLNNNNNNKVKKNKKSSNSKNNIYNNDPISSDSG